MRPALNPNQKTMLTAAVSLAAAVILTLWCSSTWAHTGADAGRHHGGVQGFIHPFTGLDHVCAMLGVGLWNALSRGSRQPSTETAHHWPLMTRGLLPPLAFSGAMLLGAWLGLTGWTFANVEALIASSVVLIGLLAISRQAWPGLITLPLIGVFALFHGLAHGTELRSSPEHWSVLFGMLAATLLLHSLGWLIGWKLCPQPAWQQRLPGAAMTIYGAALLLT